MIFAFLLAALTITPDLPNEGLATAAIQQAVDKVSAAGGGRVVIPKGCYETGGILLKDGVTLELAEGSTLLGSTNIADYVAFSRLAPDAPDFFR